MGSYCRFNLCAKGPEEDLKKLSNLFRPDQEYISFSGNLKRLKERSETEDFKKIVEKIEDKWSEYMDENLSFSELHKVMIEIYDEIYSDIEVFLDKRGDLHDAILKTLFVKTLNMESEKDYLNPPMKPHLLKILNCEGYFTEDNDKKLFIMGYCMQSVKYSFMSDGGPYKENEKSIPRDIYKGVALDIWIKDHPDTVIEIISQNDEIQSAERYLLKDGKITERERDALNTVYCDDAKTLKKNPQYKNYKKAFKNFEDYYKGLSDDDKKYISHAFIDAEHPDYLTCDESFIHTGHYSPEFSI